MAGLGWWTWPFGAGAVPNATVGDPPSVGPGYRPGDPDGLELVGEATFSGERAAIVPSPWDGWPGSWASPLWGSMGSAFDDLVDTAWAALDLNSSVLSTMPVYRARGGRVLPPVAWMANPDPAIYTSWDEFAKQLFNDYQLGEAFVLPMAWDADDRPYNFRVIPPFLINVEMVGGRREYHLGDVDVTGEVLHIRYKSRTDLPRGMGPLEAGRTRLIAAGVLARYAAEIADSSGVPHFVLQSEMKLTKAQALDLLDQWWESRTRSRGQPGRPGVLSGGVKAVPLQISPKDLTLLELEQFTEARIAVLLGVPPVLLGLPSGGDSMTYSNITSLFQFHDRASLRPKALAVTAALSGWALPRGQSVELNRDEYSRPTLTERAEAYAKLVPLGVLSVEEARALEHFTSAGVSDDGGVDTVQAITGGLTGGLTGRAMNSSIPEEVS